MKVTSLTRINKPMCNSPMECGREADHIAIIAPDDPKKSGYRYKAYRLCDPCKDVMVSVAENNPPEAS